MYFGQLPKTSSVSISMALPSAAITVPLIRSRRRRSGSRTSTPRGRPGASPARNGSSVGRPAPMRSVRSAGAVMKPGLPVTSDAHTLPASSRPPRAARRWASRNGAAPAGISREIPRPRFRASAATPARACTCRSPAWKVPTPVLTSIASRGIRHGSPEGLVGRIFPWRVLLRVVVEAPAHEQHGKPGDQVQVHLEPEVGKDREEDPDEEEAAEEARDVPEDVPLGVQPLGLPEVVPDAVEEDQIQEHGGDAALRRRPQVGVVVRPACGQRVGIALPVEPAEVPGPDAEE